MRKIFFDLLKENIPKHPNTEFKRIFFEEDKVYEIIIRKKLTGYDLNFFVSKKIFPDSGSRITEHSLSDKAIEKISSNIQEKFKEAIYEYFNWDED
jgi:excinuclease UvrABC helicase subunit UvrB